MGKPSINKDSLHENISALAKTMAKIGLHKLALVLDRLVGSRSPTEHTRWDQKLRKPAVDAVVESLEFQAAQDEELTPDAQQIVANLPQVEERIPGVKEKDEELILIEETGGLQTSKDHVSSRQPADILWSLVRLRSDERAIKAFFSRKQTLGIRDHKDWQDFKMRHVAPILRALREAFGQAYSSVLWSVAAQASRLYSCRLEKLWPEDVYTRAFQFYTDCGLAQSVTFSTSSGLPNPLERHGTDWYLDRYKVDPTNEAVADLLLKNPFRTDNFAKGILNDQVPCTRLYVWELQGTKKALRKAYDAIPTKEKRDLFISDSIEELGECLALPQLRIVEVPVFDSWMTRLTRNGPNSIMISFRGPISKRISHAVNINFSRAEEINRICKLVLPVGTAITLAAYPSIALGILLVAAIGIEEYAYDELKKKIFTRGSNWQTGRIEGLNEIKTFGTMSKGDINRTAEMTIHRMLSL